MTSGDQAKAMFFEALACLDDKNFAAAEILFANTLKLVPGHISSLNNLAVAQFEQRKFAEASATYDQLLTLKPDLVEGWLGRGNLLTELTRFDEALSAIDTALMVVPRRFPGRTPAPYRGIYGVRHGLRLEAGFFDR